jgi:23S rRNA pseudouridine1911/1915/1917 synthase
MTQPRAFEVPEELSGRALSAVVRLVCEVSWAQAKRWVETGKVRVGGEIWTDGRRRVRGGEAVEVLPAAPSPRTAARRELERDLVHYVDAHVVVVNKPSGLPTVPFGDEPRDVTTLDAVVRDHLVKRFGMRGRAPLGVVQRLDKLTSGLLVFARTLEAKKHLAQQLRRRTMHREYWAVAYGQVPEQTFRSYLNPDRGDGLRGTSASGEKGGQLAITHVAPVERLEGATLLSCRLETGRTHQIRIHLSEAGHPLLGEPVYVRRFDGAPLYAPRLMLHARGLGFEHPATGRWMSFEVDPPADFMDAVARLRPARARAAAKRSPSKGARTVSRRPRSGG